MSDEQQYTVETIPRDAVAERLPLYREVYGDKETVYQHFVVIKDAASGKPLGFCGLETGVVLGPLVVLPEHRGGEATKLLILATLKKVAGANPDSLVVLATHNRFVEQTVEELGVEATHETVYIERLNFDALTGQK